jgi:predicted membrane metal-binding protein
MPSDSKIKISSNRSFGLLFFVVFLIVALWPLKYEEDIRSWSLALSIIFLILGVLNSKLLTPLNKLWFKFGIFLGFIVSPIVMGIVYFLVVTPIGTFMRLLGKDLLKTSKVKSTSTYWIKRDKKHGTMKKQF